MLLFPKTRSRLGTVQQLTSRGRARRFSAGLLFSVVIPSISHAQIWERMTNPKSNILVTHPPQVVLKGITKIAVLEFTGTGRCGPELTERVSAELGRSSKFELIDRSSIDAVLREQGFQMSGAVSPAASVKIGAMIGPVAVFTGRVLRCSVEESQLLRRDDQDRRGRVTRTFTRRTSAQLVLKVSLIDLTTGKVIAGPLIERSDTLANSSEQGDPEAPSSDAVLSKAYAAAVTDISHMIFPWRETVRVFIHDDKKCDLKSSAAQIKAGQFVEAATALQTSIDSQCGAPTDTVLLSKAYYNLGVALTYSDHPTEGLRALQQSESMRRTGITEETLTTVREIVSLQAKQRRLEANAVELGVSTKPTVSNDARAAGKSSNAQLTNKEVIALVKAKLSDAIIANQIRTSSCKFDTSTPALIALKGAGVSDALILAISDAAATRCK